MSILDIIKQREQEAKKVKASGILDRSNEAGGDELAEIKDFSFNVAWHFEGENKRAADRRMNELKSTEETGYAIDYSTMN